MSDDLRRLEPGERAPASGQYAVFDNLGNLQEREVTCVKGKPLPPIPGGGFYLLADRTRHSGDTEVKAG